MKQVIQLNEYGEYIGITIAQESPLEAGVYLMPKLCIDTEAPVIPEGHKAVWGGSSWQYVEVVEEVELTQEEIDAQSFAEASADWTYTEWREYEYPPMTEYLDAIVKGDLVQQQAYIDACLAVKAKYPKPE